MRKKLQRVKYAYAREKKQNPYIGFTGFQHFRNDELYSDLIVKPENNMTETEHVECYPVPDYVEEKERAQGYYPDASVVYIRILWKEFEPKEREYNYTFARRYAERRIRIANRYRRERRAKRGVCDECKTRRRLRDFNESKDNIILSKKYNTMK